MVVSTFVLFRKKENINYSSFGLKKMRFEDEFQLIKYLFIIVYKIPVKLNHYNCNKISEPSLCSMRAHPNMKIY